MRDEIELTKQKVESQEKQIRELKNKLNSSEDDLEEARREQARIEKERYKNEINIIFYKGKGKKLD